MNMDLVKKKWIQTGLLQFVRPENVDAVVARLENAAQLALNKHNKVHLENEIILMRDQGLLGTGPDNQRAAVVQLTEEMAVMQLGETLAYFKSNNYTLDQVLATVKVAWHAHGRGV
jgi:hypothetical protein